jgi:phosphoglycerate dehydrogenase-like enzyme
MELAELLKISDYVSIHSPLTPETKGMFNADAFAQMKKGSYVVNTARGPIIDEAALIDALRAEKIGGAALDTFNKEPLPPDSPLWTLPNVMITPHTSNSSPKVRERTLALFVENVRRYKAGEPLLNRVNVEAGY